LHFKIDQKNISELAQMDIQVLADWFSNLESRLNERQNLIAAEVLKEIRKANRFPAGYWPGLPDFRPPFTHLVWG
jgi:excinuclease UvrABC ATPase subunit